MERIKPRVQIFITETTFKKKQHFLEFLDQRNSEAWNKMSFSDEIADERKVYLQMFVNNLN